VLYFAAGYLSREMVRMSEHYSWKDNNESVAITGSNLDAEVTSGVQLHSLHTTSLVELSPFDAIPL
jgi:hypothetical protein